MFQQMRAWKYRNGNARRSDRTVVQEHNVSRVRISYERRTCSHGRRGAWRLSQSLGAIWAFQAATYREGLVRVGSRSMSDGTSVVDLSVIREKRQFMLVVGGNAIGEWVLLVIDIMGFVGTDVVCRGHAGHCQEGLATQRAIPEHLPCARLEHC